MTQEDMAKILHNNEQHVLTTYRGLTDQTANKIRASRLWTVRDELAHIVSWLDEISKEIQFLVNYPGETIPWEIATDSSPTGYDKWNHARVKEMDCLKIADLLQRYSAAKKSLVKLILGLSEKQLTWSVEIPWEGRRTIGQLIAILTQHEQIHLQRTIKSIQEHCRQ